MINAKKLVSLMLVFCLSGVNSVWADDDSWKINFVGADKPKGDKYYACEK